MFEHCRYCKPPKRYPGCQDHCPDGISDKAKYEAQKGAYEKKNGILNSVYEQRSDMIAKAVKRQRKR